MLKRPRIREFFAAWSVELILGFVFLFVLAVLSLAGLPNFSPDTDSYINQAHSLLSGHGFSENGMGYYQPEFFRTPLACRRQRGAARVRLTVCPHWRDGAFRPA